MPLDKTAWDDDTIMPWGKHKDVRLGDVPPEYLVWFYERSWAKDWPGLYAYVKANEDAIMQDAREDTNFEGDMETWDDYMDSR